MRSFFLSIVMAATMSAVAQTANDDVLLTIDNKQISKEEFVRLYQKNNTDVSFDSASLAAYMQLFIDYKLKVVEAEQLGMDTTHEFRNEFEGYCAQLEKPYLTDASVDDSLAREAYEHMKTDVKAAHILIRCPENASGADTLKAYNRIQVIRNRALKGEDFGKLARETSEDPSAAQNNGDLGYFTAFSMIYEFEKAAYATEVGNVSPAFRTRYGYHIIKVTDRRPDPGQVHVAHIMVRVPQNANAATQKAASDKAKMIADSLAAGANWAQMVRLYSEDKGSVAQNGNLQWFGTGVMVPEFEDAAFALKNTGDISAPIRTSYGWHIIKLLDRKTLEPFDKLKDQIDRKLSRDLRSQMAQKAVVERLKKEYKFTEDKAALNELINRIDTTVWYGKWSADKAKGLNKTIFTIADTIKFTQRDYAGIVANWNAMQKKNPIDALIANDYNKRVEKCILDLERTQLIHKYPDYKYLRSEYHDGIILFALMDKMVWTKAATDSTGLEQFYEANKQNYMWDERVEVAYCSYDDNTFSNPDKNNKFSASNKKSFDSKMVTALKAGTKNGDYETQIKAAMQKNGISPDSIGMGGNASIFNIVDDKWYDIDGIRIDKDSWGKNKSKIMNYNGRTYIFYLVRNLPPTTKKLDECRGAAISDYQNKLEADWIAELRKKHMVRIDNNMFNSMIKKQ